MAADASFTEAVRQELARLPLGSDAEVRAELAGLLGAAGSLTVVGGEGPDRRRLELTTTSGAVARRTFSLLQHRYGLRPELVVRRPSGVRSSTTYGVWTTVGTDEVVADLGLVDRSGRPDDGPPGWVTASTRRAYVRGAVLGAGSLSAPGRPAHLEIAVGSHHAAEQLAACIRLLVDGTVTASAAPTTSSERRPSPDRHRVVVKSGATVGELLAALGATRAFLAWDEHRLRRQLRSDANRLANADAANLRRTIEAASAQVQAVERVVAVHGWDALDDELRAVALARLANPTASLTELGELVDPPVGKSAVHRRLRRLEALDPEAAGTSEAAGGPRSSGP